MLTEAFYREELDKVYNRIPLCPIPVTKERVHYHLQDVEILTLSLENFSGSVAFELKHVRSLLQICIELLKKYDDCNHLVRNILVQCCDCLLLFMDRVYPVI